MARGQDQAGYIKPQQGSHMISMDWACAHTLCLPNFRIQQCSELPPRPDSTKKKGRMSESETLELTDLLTIIILSFKLEISQISKIKLFIAELCPILYYLCREVGERNDYEIKIYIYVYLPT